MILMNWSHCRWWSASVIKSHLGRKFGERENWIVWNGLRKSGFDNGLGWHWGISEYWNNIFKATIRFRRTPQKSFFDVFEYCFTLEWSAVIIRGSYFECLHNNSLDPILIFARLMSLSLSKWVNSSEKYLASDLLIKLLFLNLKPIV